MKTNLIYSAGLVLALAVGTTGILASTASAQYKPKTKMQEKEEDEKPGKAGPMTAPMAKISPVMAMDAAKKKVGGKPVMALFEFDEGRWNYGVIVVKGAQMMEVDVDPMTGKAGATEAVTPDDEAKEFKAALMKLAKSK